MCQTIVLEELYLTVPDLPREVEVVEQLGPQVVMYMSLAVTLNTIHPRSFRS